MQDPVVLFMDQAVSTTRWVTSGQAPPNSRGPTSLYQSTCSCLHPLNQAITSTIRACRGHRWGATCHSSGGRVPLHTPRGGASHLGSRGKGKARNKEWAGLASRATLARICLSTISQCRVRYVVLFGFLNSLKYHTSTFKAFVFFKCFPVV